MPGTKGNRNAVTHCVHGFLALGTLPKGASYIRKLLGRFRVVLEDTIRQQDGDITLYKAALVQSACRHEGRAQLLTRWLRLADGELKLPDKLQVLREIGNATDARDKALKSAGLDWSGRATTLTALYSAAIPTATQDAVERDAASADSADADTASNAQDGRVANVAGDSDGTPDGDGPKVSGDS